MRKANLLLLFLWAYCMAQGQSGTSFLHYGVAEGLSQNSVHAIFRDSKGLMWFGTQDGLNTFDGKQFTVFRHSETDTTSISDQFILQIAEDPSGRIWVGTRNGLNCFQVDNGTFKRYYIHPSEKQNFQSEYSNFSFVNDTVLVFKDGVYALTPQNGKFVKLMSDDKWKSFLPANGYACWVVSSKGDIAFIKDVRKPVVERLGALPDSLLRRGINPRLKQVNGKLVVHNQHIPQRLWVYDPQKKQVTGQHKLSGAIYRLIADGDSGILACTSNAVEELLVDDEGRFQVNTSGISEQLPSGFLLSALRDKEGNLWASYAGQGIRLINPVFDHYRLLHHNNELFRSVVAVGDTIYAGSRNGLYRMLPGWDQHNDATFEMVLPGKVIEALAVSNRGEVFIAVEGDGIWKRDANGRLGKFASILKGEFAFVLHLLYTKKHQLYVGTTSGVKVLDGLTGKPLNNGVSKQVSGTYIMSSFEDKTGNIWVSHNHGLNVFTPEGKQIRYYSSISDTGSFIRRTIVSNVCEGEDGAFWIATIRNGMYRLSGDSSTHFTTESGMPSDVVYNVQSDSEGRIWATTSSGLCVYEPKDKRIYALTPLDGVPRRAYIFGTANKVNQGLFFGTTDGILLCKTRHIQLKSALLEAFVSSITVNDESVGDLQDGIRMRANNKLVKFELGYTPAFFPGTVIYQYRLIGVENEWQTLPEGVSQVSYNGLPFKELVMEVRASPSVSGLQEAHVHQLMFKNVPPFHRTIFFQLLAFALMLFLVYLGVSTFNRRKFDRERRKLEMERSIQAERVRLGRDLHDNIGAYTSALISGINRIQPADDVQQKQMADLREYGTNMMGLLRETIWMLHSQTLTVTALADRFKQFALRIGKNFPKVNLLFSENIQRDRELAPETVLHLFRILQEALSNALKHSGADEIHFRVSLEETLQFELEDNGSGISDQTNGNGYGLANMKERAREAGFDVEVTGNAHGTIVSVKEHTANAAFEHKT